MSHTTTIFLPPRTFTLGNIHLKMLSPEFADVDFEAVMASADTIRHLFGATHEWPAAEMTFEQNKTDLARHEREFDEKKAFAYALLDASGEQYLGCLYLEPVNLVPHPKLVTDATNRHVQIQAFIWASSLYPDTQLAPIMAEVNIWLTAYFNLDAIAWPGRVESWDEWTKFEKMTRA